MIFSTYCGSCFWPKLGDAHRCFKVYFVLDTMMYDETRLRLLALALLVETPGLACCLHRKARTDALMSSSACSCFFYNLALALTKAARLQFLLALFLIFAGVRARRLSYQHW